jgi:hypothetical protein
MLLTKAPGFLGGNPRDNSFSEQLWG